MYAVSIEDTVAGNGFMRVGLASSLSMYMRFQEWFSKFFLHFKKSHIMQKMLSVISIFILSTDSLEMRKVHSLHFLAPSTPLSG